VPQRGEGVAPSHAAHDDPPGLPRDFLRDTGDSCGPGDLLRVGRGRVRCWR